MGIMLSFYRGLTFGDSAGMDKLGLDVTTVRETLHSRAHTFIGILGTVAFNILILNLLIGVYGNEYNRVMERSVALFQRERARYCCHSLLSRRLFRLSGGAGRRRRMQASVLLALGCSIALLCFLVVTDLHFFGPAYFSLVFICSL